MRRFVARLLIALVPFVAFLAFLFRVAYVTEMELLKKDLMFPVGTRAVVVGDSRAAMHFDPEAIPWLKNCGLSAAPFEITAQKAKLIVEVNPDLEFIIIEMWPDKFFRDKMPFENAAPYGVSLLEVRSREDMPPLGDNFLVRLSQGLLKPGLAHAIFRDLNAKSQLAGGFEKKHVFLKDTKWAKLETYTRHSKYEYRGEVPYGEQVLENLLKWMREHKKKVVLVSTPIYYLWWENYYSESARTYFESRMEEIAQKYGVKWYNWMHEYQDDVNCWLDGDHLNDLGSRKFSLDKRPIFEFEEGIRR